MTVIVGTLCKRGVVIGADSSATFTAGQFRVMEQPFEKIKVVGESVIFACTGAIGLAQRFCGVIEKAWNAQQFKKDQDKSVITKKLSKQFLDDLKSTNFGLDPLDPGHQFGALLAFPANNGANLCEFGVTDFQPELKDEQVWFCSMGIGQPITDPFLALMRGVFWPKGLPSLRDGEFIVYWALEHAIKINPGGINGPIRIAVLEFDEHDRLSARLLDNKELEEHEGMIEATKKELRSFRDRIGKGEIEVPEIPQP